MLQTGCVKIYEPISTTAGKSPATLRRVKLQSRAKGTEYGSASHPSEEFVSSFITLTPEPDIPKDSSLTLDVNRDAEIAALKANLETTKKESAELSGLRGRMSELEIKVVAKSEEIIGLNKQNLELLGKVSALESVHKELSNHVSKLRVDYESLQGKIADEDKLRG
nr:hypothetical protein [Tanacetum cinerariifolium]